MRHRHLDVAPGVPASELGLAALDDLLDRGDLDDWAPLLEQIRRAPWGELADRILGLVDHHAIYGTSTLWRSWIGQLRAEAPSFHAGAALRQLRSARRLTQQELAGRLDATQSEISKLEHRQDVRLSTMRGYVAALGGNLVLMARFDDDEHELE